MLLKNLQALLLLLAGLSFATAAHPEQAADETSAGTDWVVVPAEGMDALLLLGAAAGDVMQAGIYPEEIAWVRGALSARGLDALATLDRALRQERGSLIGPTLAHLFSAGPVGTLDDVIASTADPDASLRAEHERSPGWDPEDFAAASGMMPVVRAALVELRDAGYADWYRENHAGDVSAAVGGIKDVVSRYDIVPMQARLLGRELDPRIELLVVSFSKPYGIRILGQRFVSYYGWDPETQLRVAAHEIFHPPFDRNDEDLQALLEPLRTDPWMSAIVEDHDPKYGYNSFDGVVNEDSTQALDQLVADRFGFARDPRQRWREADGGMHMLAAALYQAMQEDDFAASGSGYDAWLESALRRGLLTPAEVRRRAGEIVGKDAVDAWIRAAGP